MKEQQQTPKQPCETCKGTGIDPKQAQQSLAMPGFNVYIAAMYPCPACIDKGSA